MGSLIIMTLYTAFVYYTFLIYNFVQSVKDMIVCKSDSVTEVAIGIRDLPKEHSSSTPVLASTWQRRFYNKRWETDPVFKGLYLLLF